MVPSFVSQSEMVIYLVTEPVRPLDVQLNDGESSDVAISWGLHQITVCFIVHFHLANSFFKRFIILILSPLFFSNVLYYIKNERTRMLYV
mgnify:CR=1 FL=1